MHFNGFTSSHSSRRLTKRAIPLLAYKAGGSGASSSLPNHIDPNLGQSSAMLNQMATGATMAQPLWISGVTMVLLREHTNMTSTSVYIFDPLPFGRILVLNAAHRVAKLRDFCKMKSNFSLPSL